MRQQLKRIALTAALVTICALPAVAAKDAPTDELPARPEITYDGPLLVTPAGRTLYLYSNEDTTGPKFKWVCTNNPPNIMNDAQSGLGERPAIGYKFIRSCIQKFPPYVPAADARPVGDFTIVTRPEGGKQWAYRGFPLYTSVRDRVPGERNGAAIGGFGGNANRGGGVRYASAQFDLPPGLKFSRREEGLILASTASGLPLYTPRAGKRMLLAGAVPDEFKPLVAPAVAHVNGDWSIVSAGTGFKQYAFRGKLLYEAPNGTTDFEISQIGGWDPVVVVKGPGRPAAIGKQLTLLGEVYTDKKGMTLYSYSCNANGGGGGPRLNPVSCEEAGDPAQFMVALCGDGKECARRWRPYFPAAGAKPEGDFSIIEITHPMFTDMHGALYPSDAPKAKVWAYRGKPLFTYYEDEEPSDIWGDGTAGIWGSSFGPVMVPGRSAIFEF